MEPDFWLGRWQRDEIGFHEGQSNEKLVRYLDRLRLTEGARVFVPMCGKSVDLAWLASQGFRVAGVELSPVAPGQFFAEMGTAPSVERVGPFTRYAVPGIEIYQGDIFDMTSELIGEVDAVYDRAALVALPEPMRARYAHQLDEITAKAPQLLVSFEYDVTSMTGPPFSVNGEEIESLYGSSHVIELIDRAPMATLKTARDAFETVWLLGAK